MPRSATLDVVAAAATDLARRRHHSVVRAAHVLAILFQYAGMARRIRRLGYDADHLRARVEQALDDMPAATGYRDAILPALCPSIDHTFDRSGLLVSQYGLSALVTALEGAPELRGGFRPYVLDESLVVRLKHDVRGIDCADALTFLFNENIELATRLEDGGLDVGDLTTKSGHGWRDVVPRVVDAARNGGLPSVDPTLLVAFIARDVAYVAGYEPYVIGNALDVLLHGPPPSEEVPDDAPAEIVLLNDHLTTQLAVQEILVDCFGLSLLEAHDVTMTIDARDEAVVGRLAGAPARELATLARRKARNGGHPLRVLVRQLSK